LLQVICSGCPAHLRKIILFSIDANQFIESPRPAPLEGRFAIVINAGRDAMDADGAIDERRLRRTAKSCGPDTPTLVSSWRKTISAGDGGKRARSPGRARRKPLKPLRREGRVIPVNLW
jgi:hypothetical protein